MIQFTTIAHLLFVTLCYSTLSQSNEYSVQDQLSTLVQDSQLVVFGELHGTNEIPRYFSSVVMSTYDEHGAVRVGLEYPIEEEELLLEYLSSSGDEKAIERLVTNSEFWNRRSQDGRSSQAIFEMIERLRELSKNGNVDVYAFSEAKRKKGISRENSLAANITRYIAAKNQPPHLILTGNIHSRTRIGTPWNTEFIPMASILRNQGIELTSVELSYEDGEAWVCTSSCAQMKFGGILADAPKMRLFESPHHDYQLNVGPITASLPLVNELDVEEK